MASKSLILGDIHGAWGDAEDIIKKAQDEIGPFDQIIQVGDMGFGFPGVRPWDFTPGIPCKWVDGNHENFDLLHKRSLPNFGHDPYHVVWPQEWQKFLSTWTYMPRGTIEDGILYIGGAASIDRGYRQNGINWWPQENISYEDEQRTLDAIEDYKGSIHTIISHDCPTSFVMRPVLRGEEYHDGNRRFLEHIRYLVKPKRWFFGHYHARYSGTFEDCEWRCVDMAGSPKNQDYAIFEI